MSNIHMQLTAKGQALNAKIQAGDGTVPLEITRVVSASGRSDDPLNLESVVDIRQTAIIVGQKRIDFRAVIEVTLSNQGNPAAGEPPLTEGYPLSQFGMYANDPDEGEILYRISQYDLPNYVPAAGQMAWMINPVWNLVVGNASEVIVNVDPAGLVTVGQLNDHILQSVFSQDGVHGIRFYNGVLYVHNGVSWVIVSSGDDLAAHNTDPNAHAGRFNFLQNEILDIWAFLQARFPDSVGAVLGADSFLGAESYMVPMSGGA